MAITPEVRGTQGGALVATDSVADVEVSQALGLAAYSVPSEEERVTQVSIEVAINPVLDIEVSQAVTLAAVKGRIENRRLRAWPGRLDGHELYFLRLGESSTLVYDLTTQQWSRWASPDKDFWRVGVGMNWLGMGRETFGPDTAGTAPAESEVVAGDDTFGLLWTLAPTQGFDNHPYSSVEMSFNRITVGGIPITMRDTKPVGAAYLTASFGTPQITGATISLRTSDDFGKSWTSHGTITVEPGNYDQEFVWRSLGLIKSPGRIFELTDNGATVRIDGLEIR